MMGDIAMQDLFNDVMGAEVLSEEVKAAISEAWSKKLDETKENAKAELREEFARRYDNDKKQIVEAMDNLLGDAIKAEVEEFIHDKKTLHEQTVAYKKNLKGHTGMLDEFITNVMGKEVKELREDRVKQSNNFKKLEEFVLRQLTKELNEFHADKKALAEQKVKLVREGRKMMEDTKRTFVKSAAEKIDKIVSETMKTEMGQLKEDIKQAKENNFGRKIFETFAAEFSTSYLQEGTEVGKLHTVINDLKAKIEEHAQEIAENKNELAEAETQIRIAEDQKERQTVINDLMNPLSKSQRSVMGELLESVQTDSLKKQYNKFLPSVLNEGTTSSKARKKQQVIKENKTEKSSDIIKEVSGDRAVKEESNDSSETEIYNLRKLAGI